MTEAVIVGDIGGTNARFACAHLEPDGRTEVHKVSIKPGDDFLTFGAALQDYLNDLGQERPKSALFALAGPVEDDVVTLTHRDNWCVNSRELEATLGFQSVRLVNDYAAMARSIPELPDNCFRVLSTGAPIGHRAPILVGGPGTGLGIGTLIPEGETGWRVLTGEGGHAAFAPRTEREWMLTKHLIDQGLYVSNEIALAGKGLDTVHKALCEIDDVPYERLEPAEIMKRAQLGDVICKDICDIRTCATIDALGNAALTNGARGGVVITGGVAERLADWFDRPEVLTRFYERGPQSDYMKPISIRLMTSHTAALHGAAALFFDRTKQK